MTSEAIAEPPGLSIRSTMARTESSVRAARIARTSVSDPSTSPPIRSTPPAPEVIVPTA